MSVLDIYVVSVLGEAVQVVGFLDVDLEGAGCLDEILCREDEY